MKTLSFIILFSLSLLTFTGCVKQAANDEDNATVTAPKPQQRSPESVAARMISPAVR